MPLLWLSIFFLCGILLASIASLPWGAWAGGALVFLALSFLEKRWSAPTWLRQFHRFSRTTLALLLAALMAGAARWQVHQPRLGPADLAFYNDSMVELLGQVDGPPDRRDGMLRLKVRALELSVSQGAPRPVTGSVLVQLPAGGEWHYGERIELKGRLTAPFEGEGFSYREYLAARGIHSTLYYPFARHAGGGPANPLLEAIYTLRERAYRVIDRLYPQPEAGLLAGILLGIESDIPTSLERAYRDTGVTHIIAISGFNIAILSGLFFGLFARLVSRWWALPMAVLAIAAYTVLVGGQASVVRAAVMGAMALLGQQIGRRGAGANSLAFTAALMCAANPRLPWDAGFQLSFMATLGLVLYAGPMQQRLEAWAARRFPPPQARRLAGLLGEYLLFTLAAQVTTLPVIVYHFGRLSVSSLLANLLILPPQPLVMVLGGVSLLAGLAWLPLGQALAWATWPLPAYTNRMVGWLAGLPGGAISLGETPLWAVLLFYALMFSVTLGGPALQRSDRLRALAGRLRPAYVLIGLALLSAGLWRGAAAAPDGRLHLATLNVPGGPVFLIRTPTGQAVLVDGGTSASRLSSDLGERLPFFHRRLDALLVTARRSAALEALPLAAERFPPDLVLWNAEAAGLRNGKRLAEVLERQGASLDWLESGQALQLGQGAVLRVLLHNALGTALLLEYGSFQALIPGGTSPETLQRAFAAELTGVDVVLLDTASLAAGSTAEWEALPAVVFVWQGQGNSQMPPGARWLHLDAYRWVAFDTDGRRLWASSGK